MAQKRQKISCPNGGLGEPAVLLNCLLGFLDLDDRVCLRGASRVWKEKAESSLQRMELLEVKVKNQNVEEQEGELTKRLSFAARHCT